MNLTHLSQTEFDKLPEYSMSVPTGTTIGKRWKHQDPDGTWMICEYTHHFINSRGQERTAIGYSLPEIDLPADPWAA